MGVGGLSLPTTSSSRLLDIRVTAVSSRLSRHGCLVLPKTTAVWSRLLFLPTHHTSSVSFCPHITHPLSLSTSSSRLPHHLERLFQCSSGSQDTPGCGPRMQHAATLDLVVSRSEFAAEKCTGIRRGWRDLVGLHGTRSYQHFTALNDFRM